MSHHHLQTPTASNRIRVMKVWSKDGKRSQVIVNTKATFDSAYAGRLATESGGGMVADENTLSEAEALAWLAAERAVAQEQFRQYDAERTARIADASAPRVQQVAA